MVDDHHSVGHPLGLGQLVGGQQDTHPLVARCGDDVSDHDPAFGVYAGGGLVQEEHLGLAHQSQSQGQALLLPAGQASPRGASGTSQPYQVEQRIGVFGVVVVGRKQVEHLGRPQHRVDPAFLQHDPDPRHQGVVVTSWVESEDPHRP